MKILIIALCVATGILGTNYTRAMEGNKIDNPALGVSAASDLIDSDAKTLKSVIKDKNKSSEQKIGELTKLLEKIDVNTKDSCGQSAIIYACEMGDLEGVKFLVKKGANTKETVGNSLSLLHLAVINDSSDLTKYFIEELNWNIHAVNDFNETALHLASQSKSGLPIVTYLIQKGSNPNMADKWGCTPLHYASFWGHVNIVKHLVENGANCLLENQDQKTAANLTTTPSIYAYLAFAKLLTFLAKDDAVFDKEKNIWIVSLFDSFAKSYLDAKNYAEECAERIEDTKRLLNNPRKNLFNQNKVLVEQFNTWCKDKNIDPKPLAFTNTTIDSPKLCAVTTKLTEN
ncbi:MAG: ankyrin repeat domain-containing protein [Candidatus Dependentiae bacterium]|nr:ankyrin repeat domain-containing protein [Candidatus Dependentiae bacterium]